METGLTNLLTLLGYTTVAGFFFYKLNEKTIREWREEHKQDIDKMDAKIEENRKEHREDLAKMDAKIDKIEAKWDENLKHMDAKWERLFERLLVKDEK